MVKLNCYTETVKTLNNLVKSAKADCKASKQRIMNNRLYIDIDWHKEEISVMLVTGCTAYKLVCELNKLISNYSEPYPKAEIIPYEIELDEIEYAAKNYKPETDLVLTECKREGVEYQNFKSVPDKITELMSENLKSDVKAFSTFNATLLSNIFTAVSKEKPEYTKVFKVGTCLFVFADTDKYSISCVCLALRVPDVSANIKPSIF